MGKTPLWHRKARPEVFIHLVWREKTLLVPQASSLEKRVCPKSAWSPIGRGISEHNVYLAKWNNTSPT